MNAATQLVELLELERHPVAVAFLDTPPKDLPRIEQMAAAGCGYWKRAAAGEAFYTEATDHYGCPIGAASGPSDLTSTGSVAEPCCPPPSLTVSCTW